MVIAWGRGPRLVRGAGRVTSVERAFDPLASWAESLGNGRVVDPPLPVIVDLASLFPPDLVRASWPTRSPSRSPRGLNLTGYATGELLGWAHSSSGAWITCVRFVVEPVDKTGQVPMMQWVPAASIRPT